MHKRIIIHNSEKANKIQRNPYYIIEEGKNITPKHLNDSVFPSVSDSMAVGLPALKTPSMPPSERSTMLTDSSSSYSLGRRHFTSRGGTVSSSFYTMTSTPSDISWALEEEEESDTSWEDRAPSMFRLREDPPPRAAPRMTSFTVNLTETQTVFHLQLPSKAASVASDQGKIIAEANLLYDKSINTSKTKTDTATQTVRIFEKHKKPFITRNQRANASTFASVWDIYDSMLYAKRESGLTTMEGEVQHDEEQKHHKENVKDVIEFEGHTLSTKVLDDLMVLERLIQQNEYGEKQLLYRGLMLQDPLSSDVTCNYTLSLLWTFKSEHTRRRKVTSIAWCSEVDNILAVGYGKLKYTDKCDGLVCIWNVKQPNSPERRFHFKDPVTCLSFSHTKKQILAVSFYSGLVLLVDITSRSLMIKASNQHYPLCYPVCQVNWIDSEESSSSMSLVTCNKNGRIYKYKKTNFFLSKKIMTIGKPHGNIQGVELPRKCYPQKTQTCQNPSAEVFVCHPGDPLIYLVGSSEGCVYTCSLNQFHDHIDVFVAHHGPVYAIQFNPFCNKVFLTGGADWCIRIWAETIYEPLITLESGMTPVYNAVWNPLNSTIIVNTSGDLINVWDIRRTTIKPKSTTESPTRAMNSVLQFTENKYNVCVGDADGNVHMMALTGMPFSPTFQEAVLAESIVNSLISQPELLHKLRRLGPPFAASKELNYRAKMYRRLNTLHRTI